MTINNLLLVFLMGLAFLGDEEGGAEPDANGTKRQGGGDSTAVAMRPAATTGTGEMASTTCGMSGKLAILPVWPPAS